MRIHSSQRVGGQGRGRHGQVWNVGELLLIEILEVGYDSRFTIVTSQHPPTQRHDRTGEPSLADAICDRLLHNAHRLVLERNGSEHQ